MLNINNLVGFGAGVSGRSARYWRVLFTDAVPFVTLYRVAIYSLEMYSTVGGSNLCIDTAKGSARSSAGSGYPPSYAFDGSLSTAWMSGDPLAMPGWFNWLAYTFASPVSIVQYAITHPGDLYGAMWAPVDFSLQCSQDGVTWETVHTVENETALSGGAVRKEYTV